MVGAPLSFSGNQTQLPFAANGSGTFFALRKKIEIEIVIVIDP